MNKVVWITGASSGIGKALAFEWAKQHCNIALTGRNTDELQQVKNQLEQIGTQAHVFYLDLEKQETHQACFNEILAVFGRIDILVNNGGISQRSLAIESKLEVDRKVMEVNFFGAVSLTKLVLPLFIKQGNGQIVVLSSIAGKFGFPLRSIYSASKFALVGYFESVALENEKHNIFVTLVYPGRVKTNISVNAVTADGKVHGKMDKGQEEGISAQQCAQKIVKGVAKKKRNLLIGGKEVLLAQIKRFFPALFYVIAKRVNPK